MHLINKVEWEIKENNKQNYNNNYQNNNYNQPMNPSYKVNQNENAQKDVRAYLCL